MTAEAVSQVKFHLLLRLASPPVRAGDLQSSLLGIQSAVWNRDLSDHSLLLKVMPLKYFVLNNFDWASEKMLLVTGRHQKLHGDSTVDLKCQL